MTDIYKLIRLSNKNLFDLGKFLISIGVICMICYCMKIGFLPMNMSLGESFFFLIIAISFGFIYGFILLSFISLGAWSLPLLKLTFWCLTKFTKKKPTYQLAKFNEWSLLFGFLGIFLISLFSYEFDGWNTAITLVGVSIALFLLYSTVKGAYFLSQRQQQEENRTIEMPYQSQKNKIDSIRHESNILIGFIFIIIAPICLLTDLGSKVLDMTMKPSGVRIEGANIFIREPYFQIINQNTDLLEESKQFRKIDKKIDILFTGFGSQTLIQYKLENGNLKNLSLPSTDIIIEKDKLFGSRKNK